MIGARGPYGVLAPATELNKWFRADVSGRATRCRRTIPSYQMAQAILGIKTAYEKAQAANGGNAPTQDQIIAAFENLTFEAPSGTVQHGDRQGPSGGAGHRLRHDQARRRDRLTITNVKRYPAEKVNPPDGVKSEDWIKSGFKAK